MMGCHCKEIYFSHVSLEIFLTVAHFSREKFAEISMLRVIEGSLIIFDDFTQGMFIVVGAFRVSMSWDCQIITSSGKGHGWPWLCQLLSGLSFELAGTSYAAQLLKFLLLSFE
jgi:hypothetical protein